MKVNFRLDFVVASRALLSLRMLVDARSLSSVGGPLAEIVAVQKLMAAKEKWDKQQGERGLRPRVFIQSSKLP